MVLLYFSLKVCKSETVLPKFNCVHSYKPQVWVKHRPGFWLLSCWQHVEFNARSNDAFSETSAILPIFEIISNENISKTPTLLTDPIYTHINPIYTHISLFYQHLIFTKYLQFLFQWPVSLPVLWVGGLCLLLQLLHDLQWHCGLMLINLRYPSIKGKLKSGIVRESMLTAQTAKLNLQTFLPSSNYNADPKIR